MRARQRLFAITITSLALLACAPTHTQAPEPAGPTPSDDHGQASSGGAHVDPVPGALERMKRWPGLGDAVTEVVMNSPRGRIHGHDAERIDIEVDDDKGTAEVLFVLPASFELHGDRRLACVDQADGWRCTEE